MYSLKPFPVTLLGPKLYSHLFANHLVQLSAQLFNLAKNLVLALEDLPQFSLTIRFIKVLHFGSFLQQKSHLQDCKIAKINPQLTSPGCSFLYSSF